MNWRKMLEQTIKLNLDQYFAYIFSLVISVSFFFTELIFYNSYVTAIGLKNIFILPSIAVFNTMLWSIFTYISFIKYRQKEFTTFLTLGMTCSEIKMLIFMENVLTFFIYMPIGLILGAAFSKIIVLFALKLSGMLIFTFKFQLIVFIVTIGYYVFLTVIFILWTFKFIDKLSVINEVNYKNLYIKYSKKEELAKTIISILVLCYINFKERMFVNFQSRYYVDYSLICTLVIYILFLVFIKIFVVFIKRSKSFYYKRILLVNELEDSFKKNKYIILFIIFLNTIFITSNRVYSLPNVKTFFNIYSIFRGSAFNFIYMFIVLLSFIVSSNILYFKAKIDFCGWQLKRTKLYYIGLIDKEIDTLLTYKIRIIFFLPALLTVLTSIVYIYVLNTNGEFKIDTFKILAYYVIVQLLGYIITKKKIAILNN
ncbi:FtsX-like permease family protein [Clostridium coskatii]|nr:FtsX-like permease family protein [Clostridium coskatii]